MNDMFNQAFEHEERVRKAIGFDAVGALAAAASMGGVQKLLREEEELQRLMKLATGRTGVSVVFSQCELEEAKRVTDVVSSTLGPMASASAPARIVAEKLREQELLNRKMAIDGFLTSTDVQTLHLMATSGVQTIAEQVAAGIQSMKRPWEAATLQSQLSYALGGLYGTATSSLTDRFGAVSMESLAAIALEEMAGISAATSHLKAIEKLTAKAVGLTAYDRMGMVDQVRRVAMGDELAVLIRQVTHNDHFAALAFEDATSVSMLANRMEQMPMPWLASANEVRSATAFARLQAIGDVVANASPYASAVGSWLRSGGLGDWRDTVTFDESDGCTESRTTLYVDQGVDIESTEADPKIFVASAAIATLFAADDNWAEIWVPAAEDGEQLAMLAFARLRKFEKMLRVFIRKVMERSLGPKWMHQRLPNNMLEDWKERQEKSRDGSDYDDDLMSYADFTDYVRIIERKDNWNQVFSGVFVRKEDVKESLQRLHPMRLATMHARTISTMDLMLLLCESKRIANVINGWVQTGA